MLHAWGQIPASDLQPLESFSTYHDTLTTHMLDVGPEVKYALPRTTMLSARLSSSDVLPVCSSPREVVLNSVNIAVVAALFNWGTVPRPANLGVQDYGSGIRSLGLCPATPNCLATSEEANDNTHYAPPL